MHNFVSPFDVLEGSFGSEGLSLGVIFTTKLAASRMNGASR